MGRQSDRSKAHALSEVERTKREVSEKDQVVKKLQDVVQTANEEYEKNRAKDPNSALTAAAKRELDLADERLHQASVALSQAQLAHEQAQQEVPRSESHLTEAKKRVEERKQKLQTSEAELTKEQGKLTTAERELQESQTRAKSVLDAKTELEQRKAEAVEAKKAEAEATAAVATAAKALTQAEERKNKAKDLLDKAKLIRKENPRSYDAFPEFVKAANLYHSCVRDAEMKKDRLDTVKKALVAHQATRAEAERRHAAATAELSMAKTDLDEFTYTLVKGANRNWVQGKTEGLVFKIVCVNPAENKRLHGNFKSLVVDNKEVAAGNFGTSSGSLVFVLKDSFLEKLPEGDHSLRIRFADGEEVAADFTTKLAAAEPGNEIKPEKPEKPEPPAKPEKPETPSKPIEGAKPSESGNVAAQPKSAANVAVAVKKAPAKKNSAPKTGNQQSLTLLAMLMSGSAALLEGMRRKRKSAK